MHCLYEYSKLGKEVEYRAIVDTYIAYRTPRDLLPYGCLCDKTHVLQAPSGPQDL
jgi:hypothetical protein